MKLNKKIIILFTTVFLISNNILFSKKLKENKQTDKKTKQETAEQKEMKDNILQQKSNFDIEFKKFKKSLKEKLFIKNMLFDIRKLIDGTKNQIIKSKNSIDTQISNIRKNVKPGYKKTKIKKDINYDSRIKLLKQETLKLNNKIPTFYEKIKEKVKELNRTNEKLEIK